MITIHKPEAYVAIKVSDIRRIINGGDLPLDRARELIPESLWPLLEGNQGWG